MLNDLKKEYQKLVDKFVVYEKKEELSLGMFDSEIRIFIVHALDELIKNVDDEEKYFNVLNLLNIFLEQFLYGAEEEWSLWSNIDLSPLSKISSGFTDDKVKLMEIKKVYI